MKYPKMILFDYGRTLAYEPGWDSLRGNAALLRYAVKNDGGYTAEDVGRVAKRIDAYVKDIRNSGYEITRRAVQPAAVRVFRDRLFPDALGAGNGILGRGVRRRGDARRGRDAGLHQSQRNSQRRRQQYSLVGRGAAEAAGQAAAGKFI